ncbi:AAA family ATPase [Allochromatium vinosum]|uniref:AAA family ATPase n=1 Tax=Allochromatium vinosum TaxID=1049 RepID=UPI00190705F7
MFKSIRIHGYKSISSLEIHKIPDVLLVGGCNNSGKSTFLEAIFLFLDRMNPDMLTRHFYWRGINVVALDPEHWWKPSFHNYDFNKPIEISLKDSRDNWHKFSIAYDPNFSTSDMQLLAGVQQRQVPGQRSNQDSPQLLSPTKSAVPAKALKITEEVGGKVVQDSFITIQPNQMPVMKAIKNDGMVIPGIFLSSTSRTLPQEDAMRYGQLDLQNKSSVVLDILRLIEPRIRDLSVISLNDGAIIHCTLEGLPRKVPVSLMGDGVSRTLSIVLAILTTENGIVLIDEVENGIHHSKLQDLWSAIHTAARSAKCQIISTTHSYECLAAASKAASACNDLSFGYIRLQRRNSSAEIQAIKYEQDELMTALDAELEVR